MRRTGKRKKDAKRVCLAKQGMQSFSFKKQVSESNQNKKQILTPLYIIHILYKSEEEKRRFALKSNRNHRIMVIPHGSSLKCLYGQKSRIMYNRKSVRHLVLHSPEIWLLRLSPSCSLLLSIVFFAIIQWKLIMYNIKRSKKYHLPTMA